MNFQELNLPNALLRALRDKEYERPTPIQMQAIPAALEGRDILGTAQTGTGKTAAFALPVLANLLRRPPVGRGRPIRALILTPTRELALQIDESLGDYAKYTPLRTCVVFGGVNQRPQIDCLKRGVDVLTATPGRLLDLIGQGHISLKQIEFFVLDEADRMLDMGFIHDIRRLLPLLPGQRQTLLFSATMPKTIERLAADLLNDPVRVAVEPVASVVDTIEQRLCYVEKPEKKQALISALKENDGRSVLVFSRTKHGADRIARIVSKAGIGCDAIHGDKSQTARQRALSNFKAGKTRDRHRRARYRYRSVGNGHQLRLARCRRDLRAPDRPHGPCGAFGDGPDLLCIGRTSHAGRHSETHGQETARDRRLRPVSAENQRCPASVMDAGRRHRSLPVMLRVRPPTPPLRCGIGPLRRRRPAVRRGRPAT